MYWACMVRIFTGSWPLFSLHSRNPQNHKILKWQISLKHIAHIIKFSVTFIYIFSIRCTLLIMCSSACIKRTQRRKSTKNFRYNFRFCQTLHKGSAKMGKTKFNGKCNFEIYATFIYFFLSSAFKRIVWDLKHLYSNYYP